ncbi:hypothetical protein LJC56_11215 [Christensenellaceae bacterium OttesenSCG-928-K19]|nr:hypothetical protein [Christensenellaceae bacterium OttesenSCG-928-K19]
MGKRKKRFSAARRPVAVSNIRFSNAWPVVKLVILIACVSVGVVLMVLYGFPLIEDLIKGVDPALRYQPSVEKEFTTAAHETADEEYQPFEMYLADHKTKNDPYIYGNQVIFTTRVEKTDVFQLDAVGIYDTETEQVNILPNVEKKYDNLLNPVMSGDVAVWIDSMVNGGGRIVGYDLAKNKQFVIKEYGYAIPALSIDGDILTFMQWAGDTTQRLYAYNIKTREAVTIRLFDTETGNSAADVSATDLVWSEYRPDGGGTSATLKRIVFSGDTSRFENYDLGTDVYEPKTNGKDIVFATTRDITSGNLMLSTGGSEPVKIAENVLNYDLGDNFVAYTKDDTIYISYTNQQKTVAITTEITKNLLVSVTGNGITYYDITDGILTDEVVMYTFVK